MVRQLLPLLHLLARKARLLGAPLAASFRSRPRSRVPRQLIALPVLLVCLAGCELPSSLTSVTGNLVTISAVPYPLEGQNVPRSPDALVLYTPAVGASTPTNTWGAEAVVVDGKVTQLRDRQTTGEGPTTIPRNGVVLSGNGAARTWLLLVARAGAEVRFPADAGGAAPVKVMPMGDSITAAGGVGMGYKGYLLDKLLASGLKVDYVGSQVATGPAGLKDRNHEGHSGWANKEFQVSAAQLVTTHQPDVIVYHVGTNDIFSNVDPSVAVSRLRDVLTKIYAAKPDVHIVVAKTVRMNVGKDVQMQQYNDQIPAVVESFRTQDRRITLADLSGTLNTTDLLSDGVHLTDSGNRKMADAFYPSVKAAAETFR